MTNYRVWLDTLTANNGLTKEHLEHIIANGMTVVTANTAIDVALFQENQHWFEKMLIHQHIIIEIWHMPDEMVSKPFYWSSCSQETAAAETLFDAVEDLPNGADILDVADLVEAYGIEKGKWPMGKWVPPTPLSADIAKQLGLDASMATRTDVLNAAKKANLMKVFDAYNIGYNRGLALQHNCEGIINSDGSVTPL